MDTDILKVAVIGGGTRAQNLYLPLIKKMPQFVLRGLYTQTLENATKLAEDYHATAYQSLEAVLCDNQIDIIISCVPWTANAEIYSRLGKCDKILLLETPLGHDIESVKSTYKKLASSKAYIDICEQYHMRPMEQLKSRIIRSGILGDIVYAYMHGVGHDYHGISLIRSYLGWADKLKEVCAMQTDVPYFKHDTHRGVFFPGERIYNASMKFYSGATASLHWSWLHYSSPIRNNRTSGVYGTRGSIEGSCCSIFADAIHPPKQVTFERFYKVVDGLEILHRMAAMIDGEEIASWDNPISNLVLNLEEITAAHFLLNALKAKNDKSIQPIYSLDKAYYDHIIVQHMHDAAHLQKYIKL